MASYLLQEDGTSKLILEDSSGDILLEASVGPVVTVAPGGSHIIAVAPRRRPVGPRSRGRFKPDAAVVAVTAAQPVFTVSLRTVRSSLTAHAGTVRHELSFSLGAARALASYSKHRPVDLEARIRKWLIADLFNRD